MNPVLAAAIKVELCEFVASAGTRRDLLATCHVGHPGGERTRFAHQEVTDASLRADLVERAIDGLLTTDGACAWVTRNGELGLVDADAEWFAAARAAFARHGLPLPAFFVLNRRGWVDLVSGERREWYRIRNRSTTQQKSRPAGS
jgi:hypothetical protein